MNSWQETSNLAQASRACKFYFVSSKFLAVTLIPGIFAVGKLILSSKKKIHQNNQDKFFIMYHTLILPIDDDQI